MFRFDLVLTKIAVMFLVIIVGWFARKRGYLSGDATRVIGRFATDIIFPAMVFTGLIRTVDRAIFVHELGVVVIGAIVIPLGFLVGAMLLPLIGGGVHRRTFVFLSGMANWIFLPLPIVDAVYGNDGVRFLLLFNMGAQCAIWTAGIAILMGGRIDRQAIRNLLLNPGLLGTVGGMTVALAWPGSRDILLAGNEASGWQIPMSVVCQSLELIGTLTIPMALIVTGAQLGGLPLKGYALSRPVAGVMLARLFVTPVLVLVIVNVIEWTTGYRLNDLQRMTTYIIAAMPVAVSTSMMIERYDGDTHFGALAIFYTTLFSMVTVPVMCMVVSRFRW